MGEALQIRVSAVTWNLDLVEKLWPRLCHMADEVPTQPERMGVLELVQTLSEGLRFMDWPDDTKKRMGPGIRTAEETKKAIEKALAEWKPGEANTLSEKLESTLDELERLPNITSRAKS